MVKFYIESVKVVDNSIAVTGYTEGVIRLGVLFSRAEKCLDIQAGKRIVLPNPIQPRTVELQVTKILSYGSEHLELPDRSGCCLYLEGIGRDVLRWGDVLSES